MQRHLKEEEEATREPRFFNEAGPMSGDASELPVKPCLSGIRPSVSPLAGLAALLARLSGSGRYSSSSDASATSASKSAADMQGDSTSAVCGLWRGQVGRGLPTARTKVPSLAGREAMDYPLIRIMVCGRHRAHLSACCAPVRTLEEYVWPQQQQLCGQLLHPVGCHSTQ